MKTVPWWRFLLPVFQSLFAIGLWLYIPVQYRVEALELSHLPTEHPFAHNFEGHPRFPPRCEQLLNVVNYPVFSVWLVVLNPLVGLVLNWQQSGLPEWEFTLPVGDPEALPPGRIFYSIHVDELACFKEPKGSA
jgi:hypothetical protein